MAKVAAPSTTSPRVFGLGNGIYAEDPRTVVELQHFAVAEHLRRFAHDHRPIDFPGNDVVLRGLFWIPPWMPEVRAVMATSRGGTFGSTLTLGGLTQAFRSNTTDEVIFATTSTGTGIVAWSVNGNLTGGSAQLDRLYLQPGRSWQGSSRGLQSSAGRWGKPNYPGGQSIGTKSVTSAAATLTLGLQIRRMGPVKHSCSMRFVASLSATLITVPLPAFASGTPNPGLDAAQQFFDMEHALIVSDDMASRFQSVQAAYGERPVEYRFKMLALMRLLQGRLKSNDDLPVGVDPFPVRELEALEDYVGTSALGLAGLEPVAVYLLDALSKIVLDPAYESRMVATVAALQSELATRQPLDPIREHPYYAPLGRTISMLSVEVRPDHLFLVLQVGLQSVRNSLENDLDITDLDDWMTSSEFKNEACGGSGQGGGGSGQGNLSDVPLNPGGQGSGGSGPAEPAENEPPTGLAEMVDAMGSEQEEATIDLCTEPSVSLARALRAGMANSCFNTSLISARGTDQLLSEVDNMRQCKDDYAALGQSDCSLCIGWAGAGVILVGMGLAYRIVSDYRNGEGLFADTEAQGADVPEPVPADAPDAPLVDDNEKTADQLFQEGDDAGAEAVKLEENATQLETEGQDLVNGANEARAAGDENTAKIKERAAQEKFAQAAEKRRQADEKLDEMDEKYDKALEKANGTQMGPDGVPDSIACNAMTDELYHPVEFDPQDQSIYEREDGPLPHMGDGFMELSECAAQSATPLFTSQSNCESFILCNSGTDCNCGLGLEAMGRDYTNFMNDAFVCSTTRCGDGSYPQRDGLMCRCDAPPGGGAPPGGAPGVGGGYTPLTPAFMKLIDTGFGNGATMRNSICHDSLAGVDAVEVIDAVRNDGDSIAGAAAVLEADFLATGTCSP